MVLVPATAVRYKLAPDWICWYCGASVAKVAAPKPVILKFPSGRFAVGGAVPSRGIELVSSLAISFSVVLAHVDDIVVPLTTGLPLGSV